MNSAIESLLYFNLDTGLSQAAWLCKVHRVFLHQQLPTRSHVGQGKAVA